MWEKSEKHLALSLLFILVAQPMTGWIAALPLVMGAVHSVVSFCYAWKGE